MQCVSKPQALQNNAIAVHWAGPLGVGLAVGDNDDRGRRQGAEIGDVRRRMSGGGIQQCREWCTGQTVTELNPSSC
jgi:hypothetical protein